MAGGLFAEKIIHKIRVAYQCCVQLCSTIGGSRPQNGNLALSTFAHAFNLKSKLLDGRAVCSIYKGSYGIEQVNFKLVKNGFGQVGRVCPVNETSQLNGLKIIHCMDLNEKKSPIN